MRPVNYPEILKGTKVFLLYFICLICCSTLSVYFFYNSVRYQLGLLSEASKSAEFTSSLQKEMAERSALIYNKVRLYKPDDVTTARVADEIRDERVQLNYLLKQDAENEGLLVYNKIYQMIPALIVLKDSVGEMKRERENLQVKLSQLTQRQRN